MTKSVNEIILGLAGRRTRAKYRALYPDAQDGLSDEEALRRLVPDSPLDGVAFAHPRARQIAEEAELSWSDFANSSVGPTSDTGYRTDDVRAIIKERDDADH